MIVFDLQCRGGGHVFEAWFSSSDAYTDQRARGLISCPLCHDTKVEKAIMAPNIGAKGNQVATIKSAPHSTPMMTDSSAMQLKSEMKSILAKVIQLQADTIKDSTWVGKDFERQARAMDAGELDHAIIHGQATPEQARDLIDDGIGVMPLLVPIIPPEERN
jgi:hypothetical protein